MIVFILAAFVLGLGVKHYRDTHPFPVPLPSKKTSGLGARPSSSSARTESIFDSRAPTFTPARKRTRKSTRAEELNLSDSALKHEQE